MMHRCYREADLPVSGLWLPGSLAPDDVSPIDAERGVCNPTGGSVMAGKCLEGVCLEFGEEPYHGALSFDSFAMAWVLVFMTITGEGWTDIMCAIRRSHSTHAMPLSPYTLPTRPMLRPSHPAPLSSYTCSALLTGYAHEHVLPHVPWP